MAAEEGDDFYSVLGLKKECSEADLKTAYKKLALRWHPDRCSASGNSKYVEEAKKKFQAIQEAYSVLSDANKRFLYDVGVYDPDDDDNNGMGDFLNEMAAMMSQNKSTENVEQSFEELKTLFDDMFQSDTEGIGSSSFHCGSATSFTSSTFATYEEIPNASNKRNFEMNVSESDVATSSNFDTHFQGFCFGAEDLESQVGGGKGKSSRRSGRKQKVSSGHDVSSSNNTGISAS